MTKLWKPVEAVDYLRTSSATNAGPDKDSDKRQRAAIAAFAKAEFYDATVSGPDPIAERSGFKAMLDRIAGNGERHRTERELRCISHDPPLE